jgi:subtilisin family serine protease
MPFWENMTAKSKSSTIFILVSLLLSLFSFQLSTAAGVKGVLVVKIADQSYYAKLLAFDRHPEFLFENVYRLKVVDKSFALAKLKNAPGIVFAEEDQRLKTTINASDPLFIRDTQDSAKQWYLQKMRIADAWDITEGSGITVAIVDTGIDAKHEDLNDGRVIAGYANYCQVSNPQAANECLVRNTGSLAAGVNSDDNGHGTIVAGLVGAIANNDRGMTGVSWNVLLMPVKALDSHGTGLSSDVATGIRWAVEHGARVINLSIGGTGLAGAEVLKDAAAYAFSKGAIVVAAAGNDAAATGGNLNLDPVQPVCADSAENTVIGVAAVDAEDKKARFSNYGSNCIDVAAPGTWSFVDKQNKQGLVSTYYDPAKPGEHDLYVYAVGTSVAAPLVSGVASLVMSAFPDLDVRAVRDRLISGVDNIDNLNQSGCNGSSCVGQIGKGRLNALKALTQVQAYTNGTLVQNFAGQRYLVERGLKRPVSDFVYSQRFAGVQVIAADLAQLDGYPTGSPVPPVDGTLIKDPVTPTVYLMEGENRRALSYAAFLSRDFTFDKVITLSAQEVSSYPQSADALVLDGVLLKADNHPAVYIWQGGYRQLLSYFVFVERGFAQKPIAVMSENELAQFPSHPQNYLFPPLENTLIRGDRNATVYFIENGKRRGLTYTAFLSHNFRFEDVKVLPQSEVDGYELGTDILE